jgi:hypothetical protein
MGLMKIVAAGFCALVLFGNGEAFAQAQAGKTNNWLLDAADDKERFRRIEDMFGGFSWAMAITGVRYDSTYDAIVDGNFDLAVYHWTKIKDAIDAGSLRRPARGPNAIGIFLSGPYKTLLAALESKDAAKSREAFLAARDACRACHVAERVPFMNDQPRFRRTASFPAR